MSLGAINAAVALPFQLPSTLTSSIQSSPLAGLLSLAGISLNGGVTLEGPMAQVIRRLAYLYRQPTNEQRLNVAASWVQQAADLGSKVGGKVGDEISMDMSRAAGGKEV